MHVTVRWSVTFCPAPRTGDYRMPNTLFARGPTSERVSPFLRPDRGPVRSSHSASRSPCAFTREDINSGCVFQRSAWWTVCWTVSSRRRTSMPDHPLAGEGNVCWADSPRRSTTYVESTCYGEGNVCCVDSPRRSTTHVESTCECRPQRVRLGEPGRYHEECVRWESGETCTNFPVAGVWPGGVVHWGYVFTSFLCCWSNTFVHVRNTPCPCGK